MAEKKAHSGSLKGDIKVARNIPFWRKIFLGILGLAILVGFSFSLYCTVYSMEKLTKTTPEFVVLCFATLISFLCIIYYSLSGYRKSAKVFLIPILSVLLTIVTFVIRDINNPEYFWLYLICGILFLVAFLLSFNLKLVVIFLALSFLLSVAISVQCSIMMSTWYPNLSIVSAISAYGFQWLLSLLILSILTCVIENLRRNFEAREGEKWVPRGDGKYWKFK